MTLTHHIDNPMPEPTNSEVAWGFVTYFRKRLGLVALVVVLVFSAVAANATPLRSSAADLPGVALVEWSGATPSLVAAQGNLVAAAWTPAQECGRIRPSDLKPGHYRATMVWCPYTAAALHEGEVRGRWTWNDGDLTRFMALISCESGGDPRAKNPHSSASGLGQFLDGTWRRWSPRAAAFYGFDNPQVFAAYDNILTMVYLAKVDSFSHWRCWRRFF